MIVVWPCRRFSFFNESRLLKIVSDTSKGHRDRVISENEDAVDLLVQPEFFNSLFCTPVVNQVVHTKHDLGAIFIAVDDVSEGDDVFHGTFTQTMCELACIAPDVGFWCWQPQPLCTDVLAVFCPHSPPNFMAVAPGPVHHPLSGMSLMSSQ